MNQEGYPAECHMIHFTKRINKRVIIAKKESTYGITITGEKIPLTELYDSYDEIPDELYRQQIWRRPKIM